MAEAPQIGGKYLSQVHARSQASCSKFTPRYIEQSGWLRDNLNDACLPGRPTLQPDDTTPPETSSLDSPALSEETWLQAKPMFVEAAQELGPLPEDTGAFVTRLVAKLRDTHGFTREGFKAMKPYLLRFIKEVRNETINIDQLDLQTQMDTPPSIPEVGRAGTETCGICFARDHEVLIRPAIEQRMDELVQEAVCRIRALDGAGFSGDSGLNDVFEEWADQIAGQHSVLFREYERLVEEVCRSLVKQLGNVELIVLAAFSEDFDEHSCSEGFIESKSLEGFDALDAVSNELYRQTANFALRWAEGEIRISGGSISDSRERLLNQVATRLAELLRESDDPAADQAEVVAILQNNDLLDFVTARSALKQTNPISFAVAVLEDNPLLFEAVGNLNHEFEPRASETVADLITNLLPSDGHLD